jgi:hypothetical protein
VKIVKTKFTNCSALYYGGSIYFGNNVDFEIEGNDNEEKSVIKSSITHHVVSSESCGGCIATYSSLFSNWRRIVNINFSGNRAKSNIGHDYCDITEDAVVMCKEEDSFKGSDSDNTSSNSIYFPLEEEGNFTCLIKEKKICEFNQFG